MPSIYDLSPAELDEHIAALGAPRYRGGQVREWLYRRFARSYDEMTDLPLELRARLAADLPFPDVTVVREQASEDGQTRKRLLRLDDGKLVEAVLMLYDPRGESRGRATVCVSSQAGCAMGCVFCATGQGGFERNLTTGEIIAQVTGFAREQADRRGRALTNIVFMGMGEPLANWPAVWPAVERFTSQEGMGMAARHVTISTVGLPQGIRRLAEQPLQVGLAVSLHAPDQALRERLIPTAHRFPLSEIMDACRDYIARTGRRITFEYCLMAGVNDAPAQAETLAQLVGGLLCHVNLIPVNPTPDGRIGRPSRSRTLAFQRVLLEHGTACTVRVEKGVEIAAACGQLRAEPASLPVIDAIGAT